MKIRTDFVTNSSSSSFVVSFDDNMNSVEDFIKFFEENNKNAAADLDITIESLARYMFNCIDQGGYDDNFLSSLYSSVNGDITYDSEFSKIIDINYEQMNYMLEDVYDAELIKKLLIITELKNMFKDTKFENKNLITFDLEDHDNLGCELQDSSEFRDIFDTKKSRVLSYTSCH